jgi:hypothetical protein
MKNATFGLNIANSFTLKLLLPFKITLIISTVTFNLLIIYIIKFLIKKKTYSNTIFLSKSIADVIVGASSISFMTVFSSYGYWPLGHYLCVFWLVQDYSVCSVSIFNLLLITWHRYQQLKNPFDITEDLTLFRWIKLILAWLCPFIFWSSSIIPIKMKNLKENECNSSFIFIYVLFADLFLYIIPIFILLYLNLLTYVELLKKRRRVSKKFITVNVAILRVLMSANLNNENSTSNSVNDNCDDVQEIRGIRGGKRLNRDIKAVICLVAVSILFFSTWIIFLITWPLKASECNCVSDLVYEIGYWCAYCSSTIYPLLLIIFHDAIKCKFFSIFTNRNSN